MAMCFAAEQRSHLNLCGDIPKIETLTTDRLANNFRVAEGLFIAGTVFVAVILVMVSKLDIF